MFLKISQYSEKNTCWSLFLIKVQAYKPKGLQLHQKKTPTQVFSCKYCKIARSSFLYRTSLMAASGFLTKLAENNCEENHFSVEFFSETSQKLFLVFAAAFLKITPLQVFRSFCLSLNMSEVYLEPSQTSRWSLLQKQLMVPEAYSEQSGRSKMELCV